MEKKEGVFQLTGTNIRNMRTELDSNFMIAPYQKENATGCGYNLTATEFIYSITKRRLLTIHKSKQGDTYVKIYPNDTVLILTREYIKLSGNMAGAFYSRVQMVSSGFGHISTTLDPGWRGMLLFSINNPTKRKLRLNISRSTDRGVVFKGIATMVLTPVRIEDEETKGVDPSLDNPAMRLDVLKKLVSEPKRFWADRQYQNLKKLIYDLEHFETIENSKMKRLTDIKAHLTNIEMEIASYKSIEDIQAYLVELKRIDYGAFEEVQCKVKNLDDTVCKTTDISKDVNEIKNKIESIYRECDYQLLCEKINQIHLLIQQQVPHVWGYHKMRRLLGFLLKHWKIWVVYGMAIIIVAYTYNSNIGSNDMNIFISVVAAIMPPFITYFLEIFGATNEDL